jgi:hypothetical protein
LGKIPADKRSNFQDTPLIAWLGAGKADARRMLFRTKAGGSLNKRYGSGVVTVGPPAGSFRRAASETCPVHVSNPPSGASQLVVSMIQQGAPKPPD